MTFFRLWNYPTCSKHWVDFHWFILYVSQSQYNQRHRFSLTPLSMHCDGFYFKTPRMLIFPANEKHGSFLHVCTMAKGRIAMRFSGWQQRRERRFYQNWKLLDFNSFLEDCYGLPYCAYIKKPWRARWFAPDTLTVAFHYCRISL